MFQACRHFFNQKFAVNQKKVETTAEHPITRSKEKIRAQFHQSSTYSFYTRRSQMRKKDSQVSIVILRFWAPRA